MKASEAAEVGRVLGETLVGTARRSGQLSAAILDRGYGAAARIAGPAHRDRIERVRTAHRQATTRAGQAVGRGLGAIGHGVARVGARFADGRPVVEEPGAYQAVSVLNGLYGDRLQQRHSPLSLPMALRAEGRDVPLSRGGLHAAYPHATGLVVVFIHGLVETDDWWDIRSERNWGHPGESYSRRLRAEGAWTTVRERYNTGLRVSNNGQHLDDLLDALVAGWPVPVCGLVLVGHSMGGLVLHSALAQASSDRQWPSLVRVTVTIGTPHQGAAIVRGVARLTPVLARLPETRWLAEVISSRPAGMGDLGHGNLLADDWRANRARPDPHVGGLGGRPVGPSRRRAGRGQPGRGRPEGHPCCGRRPPPRPAQPPCGLCPPQRVARLRRTTQPGTGAVRGLTPLPG